MKPIDHEAFLKADEALSEEEKVACAKRSELSREEVFKETRRRVAERGVPVTSVQAYADVMLGVISDAYKAEVIATAAAKQQHPKSAESAPGEKQK